MTKSRQTPSQSDSNQLQDFLKRVMRIQKQYAHELQNVKSERRSAILEILNNYTPSSKISDETD